MRGNRPRHGAPRGAARVHGAPLGAALVFGLAVYVAGLVVWAPASLAGALLDSASAGILVLTDAQGTLWRGTGKLDLGAGRGGFSRAVSWRFTPAALLKGRLTYEVQAGSDRPFGISMGLGTAGLGAAAAEISGLDLRLPASILGTAVPRLAPLGLTGEVRVEAPRLTVDPVKRGPAMDGTLPRLYGALSVQWLEAGSRLAPESPFGAYALTLQAGSTQVQAHIRTLKGPLDLTGEGQWENGARPALQARLRIAPDRQAKFGPFLRMFAVEKSDGQFELPPP